MNEVNRIEGSRAADRNDVTPGGSRQVAGDEQRDSPVLPPQIKECTIRASVRLRLSQLKTNVNESLCLLIINGSV